MYVTNFIIIIKLASTFKQYLELEPQLRDVILNFHHSRYTACLRILDEMRPNLMLDMYLVPHMDQLYTMIRNKALIQVRTYLTLFYHLHLMSDQNAS